MKTGVDLDTGGQFDLKQVKINTASEGIDIIFSVNDQWSSDTPTIAAYQTMCDAELLRASRDVNSYCAHIQ